ncbi:MAG: hypothetical protein RL367_2872 [Pseudomonadota bacterium]|jgi:rare lipoprotein A
MRLNRQNCGLVAALAIGLAGCGGGDYDRVVAQPSDVPVQVDASPVLGDSYSIGGKRYEPKDDAAFDQVGYARVFGADKRGSGTPNGELVNPDLIEGAHQTLPMPSYVEVTHLDTGRTVLLRINNRGPMSPKAVIELSPAAAEALGIDGSAPVRVRRVNPPMPERAALRSGRPVPARLDTPPSLLSALRRQMKDEGVAIDRGAPPVDMAEGATPVSKPVPVPRRLPPKPASKPSGRPGADFGGPVAASQEVSEGPVDTTVTRAPVQPDATGQWFVQLGAFGNEPRAKTLAKRAGVSAVLQAGAIWRVRAGPYDSEAAARAAVGQWQSKGYRDARASR